MTTILFMVSVALLLSVSFVGFYFWALSSGQYDDLETPAHRMLKDEGKKNEKLN
ncbi:MAG: cbb3-type cytochrome oxidase assembly protein CcoS [Bdellovibrionaceae bacterium]|nr:cbb3-type cytochrome oxidase assembly protein CcoS [Bdellovibrio sp.]